MTEHGLALDFIWMRADGRDMVGNGDDLSNALAANFSRIYCSNFETFSCWYVWEKFWFTAVFGSVATVDADSVGLDSIGKEKLAGKMFKSKHPF